MNRHTGLPRSIPKPNTKTKILLNQSPRLDPRDSPHDSPSSISPQPASPFYTRAYVTESSPEGRRPVKSRANKSPHRISSKQKPTVIPSHSPPTTVSKASKVTNGNPSKPKCEPGQFVSKVLMMMGGLMRGDSENRGINRLQGARGGVNLAICLKAISRTKIASGPRASEAPEGSPRPPVSASFTSKMEISSWGTFRTGRLMGMGPFTSLPAAGSSWASGKTISSRRIYMLSIDSESHVFSTWLNRPNDFKIYCLLKAYVYFQLKAYVYCQCLDQSLHYRQLNQAQLSRRFLERLSQKCWCQYLPNFALLISFNFLLVLFRARELSNAISRKISCIFSPISSAPHSSVFIFALLWPTPSNLCPSLLLLLRLFSLFVQNLLLSFWLGDGSVLIMCLAALEAF